MNPRLLLCLALVLSGVLFVQHAFGMMEEEQLSPQNAHHSHCSVKTESTKDGIHFTCRMPKMKDCGYRGCLQIANQAAMAEGYHMEKYEMQEAVFEPSEHDHMWSVFYMRRGEPLENSSEKNFWILVDDRTGETSVMKLHVKLQ